MLVRAEFDSAQLVLVSTESLISRKYPRKRIFQLNNFSLFIRGQDGLREWPKPEVLKIGFVKDTLFHQTDGRLYGTSSQPCQRMPGSDVGSGGFIVLGILLTSGSVPGSGRGFIVLGILFTSGSVPGSGVGSGSGFIVLGILFTSGSVIQLPLADPLPRSFYPSPSPSLPA